MQEIEEGFELGDGAESAVRLERSLFLRLAPAIPYMAVLLGLYLMHNVWVAAVCYHLGIVAVLLGSRRTPVRSNLKLSWAVVGINLAIGVFTGLLLYLLWPMLGTPADLGSRLHGMGLTSWTAFGLYYCAANPVMEEFFWRRAIPNLSLLPSINDALFAGYHMLVLAFFMQWKWMVVSFVLLSIASCIWRFSVRQKHGLALIISSHFLADLGIILVGYLKAPLF